MDVIYNKADGFLTRRIAGETLIVPVRGRVGDLDSLFTVNEIGGRIWSLLDGQTSIGHIAQTICEEYDVPPERATADVSELLQSMAEAGLVKAV
jgi:hypothetical protein